MSGFGGQATPGFGAAVYTQEREILWGRDDQHLPLLYRNAIISSAAVDAGNTPTTLLRRGLIMGRLTTGGEYIAWNADASDGSQNIAAVLNAELRMTDFNANALDRTAALLLRAPVIAGQLLIEGVAFVGHLHEYLARRQMVAQGFVFDDDPEGFKSGRVERFATVTGTSDTLTADENGTTLFYDNAAAVAVTLPTILPGLEYTVIRAADEELVVSSAEGDNIVFGNDLSGDSITVTTAGEQIGASYTFRSVYIGTTLKWLVRINIVPFSTDDYLAKTFAS